MLLQIIDQTDCLPNWPRFSYGVTLLSLLLQGLFILHRWSTTSYELLRCWKLDRRRAIPGVCLVFCSGDSLCFVLAEQQWRTHTRWHLVFLVYLPCTLTTSITFLFLVFSHQQFCGTPSTNSSRVWCSSWWTDTSAIWSGLIMPAAGVTWFKIKTNYSKLQIFSLSSLK